MLAEPEQLGNRIVGLQDLPFNVRNEHGVRSVGDDDVGIQRTVRFEVPAVALNHGRLCAESLRFGHSGPPSRSQDPSPSVIVSRLGWRCNKLWRRDLGLGRYHTCASVAGM